jgi:nitroreductase
MPGRDYYLFDTGMATAFLILRATELGLVAHPIAGYDEDRVKDLLGIPKDMTVITLVNIGKHSSTIGSLLTEKQAQIEKARPSRKPLDTIMSIR